MDRAAVVVADSLLAGLTQRELSGILAHEIVHLRNRDIRLQQIGLVLGWLARALSQSGLIFVLIGVVMRVFSRAEFPRLPLLVLATPRACCAYAERGRVHRSCDTGTVIYAMDREARPARRKVG